jgi:SSS family solute:Na+ symporter/sodium/pantothenate symporter
MPDAGPTAGYGVLVALVAVIGVSVWLGELAQRAVRRGSFVSGYFLGHRSLGVWAMALTATVQSGGTFMGFPSLVFSHGWIVSLWIASYMVVPITGFAVMGKRLAQLSRRTGAITLPDLLGRRYDSPAVGLVASTIIIVFGTFFLIAQFIAGAIVMKIAWPDSGALALADSFAGYDVDAQYLVGLAVFAITVVGYTMVGGFLASVWTDLFQSVLMLIGVLTLFFLAVPAAGGLENATRVAVAKTSIAYAGGPGYSPDGRQFLPLSLAASMFFHWVFTGVGSAPSIVRLMASHDTATLRRSICVLSIYNMCIYLPIIAIAISARAILPDLPQDHSDEAIPRLAVWTTRDIPGGSLVAGLILAAPFGAVMATVSALLVVITSGLVRDVYQKVVRPRASEREIRRVTYCTTLAVGLFAVLAATQRVNYLQTLVVLATSGGGAGFLVPALMGCYWRRATAAGALAAMLAGAGTVGALILVGLFGDDPGIGPRTQFRAHYLFQIEPILWGVLASLVAGVTVSLLTRPPRASHVSRLFDAQAPTPSSRL